MGRLIRLRGISETVKGKVWESDSLLRVGRLASLEVVLEDSSVSRQHAEINLGPDGWFVRDLASTNGTYVNGVRIGTLPQPLRPRDIVQFGKVILLVEGGGEINELPSSKAQHILATTPSTYEEGIRRLAFDRHQMPRPGEQLMALLRAGHHFVHAHCPEDLYRAILNDAVSVLAAQRGAILLAEGSETNPKWRLVATASGHHSARSSHFYSKKLTQRCFSTGVSLLYSAFAALDSDTRLGQSISEGAMGSVICVLLRTPRRRLGVMHLDRGLDHQSFTEDDLHLADALAAHVSATIESALLLQQQRDLFLKTITTLAQAVELRDDYTGGHTQRVTRYALLLAERLGLDRQHTEIIRLGSPLHDIGKIGIDDAILRKPGKLTPAEYELMKTHTVKGAEILSNIPEMAPIIPIVRHHHERWDGTGYPDRLAGTEIPYLARIVAVADAFDAITSPRPYHASNRPRSYTWAFLELERQAGRQFDPDCVAAFLDIRDLIHKAM
ncbi:MAG: HD domain-containing protein, partial [Thermogemmata sp.]|nr:HD domain-containing protein [Thermogemmata sp.]